MVQISCACGQLVEVVDRVVVKHDGSDGRRCLASGLRHVSRKISGGQYAGQPTVEVLATGTGKCDDCGHDVGLALVRVTTPDSSVN
jgi:hypothetical protein